MVGKTQKRRQQALKMPRNPEMDELERWLAERKKIWQDAMQIGTKGGMLAAVIESNIGVLDLIQEEINVIRKAADLAAKEEAEKALKDL
jgi:hypothetical protein